MSTVIDYPATVAAADASVKGRCVAIELTESYWPEHTHPFFGGWTCKFLFEPADKRRNRFDVYGDGETPQAAVDAALERIQYDPRKDK